MKHELRNWNGILCADPPWCADDWDDLFRQAVKSHEAREAAYPRMIINGTMTEEEAQASLDAWKAIVAHWRFIALGKGEPACPSTRAARVEAIEQSLTAVANIAREAGGFSADLSEQGQRIIALLWHCEAERERVTVNCAIINHERRAAREPQREAA